MSLSPPTKPAKQLSIGGSKMKVNYDREVGVLRILLSERQIVESDETRSDFILDYDAEGNVVGMEILNASKHAEIPNVCEFAVASSQIGSKQEAKA
jgi:uncharacterized protein YuzE